MVRNVPRPIHQVRLVLHNRVNHGVFQKEANMANSLAIPAIDSQPPPRLLLTRAETLAALRIGETTLHWLARTEKLNAVKIGARVLFSAAEVERLARRGCSLTAGEKRAATRCGQDQAQRANSCKWEDPPSAPATEADKRKRARDTEGV
jgi:hypothetical protein